MIVKIDSFVKDACLHLYNHAVGDLNLFNDNSDYFKVLNKFRKKIDAYPATVYAYCLMPNHFHFFMKQDSNVPIYKIFNDIFSGYSLYYNHKYKRKGTLFQGPLQHKLISTNKYFLELCLYIHYNPVDAKLVEKPEDWIYSNYQEWIGIRNGKLFSKGVNNILYITPREYREIMGLYSNERFEKDKVLFEN